MTLFSRRKVAQVDSMQQQVRIQEALAAQGIATSVRVVGTARAMERRARLGGVSERDTFYAVYVHKDDYERAAHLLKSLRRGQ